MVKTKMSAGSPDPTLGSYNGLKEKLKIPQRFIDLNARNLQSTRLSSRDFSPEGGGSSSPPQSEAQWAIEENMVLLENKLINWFAQQIYLKHQFTKGLKNGSEDTVLTGAHKELDRLINLEQFLNVANLEPRSVKALIAGELTLDFLLTCSLSPPEYEQLVVQKCELSISDSRKLADCLGLLFSYYVKWERGEKPTPSTNERLNSSSSRLGSISTMASSFDQDGRCDSVSSTTSSPLTPHHTSSNLPTTPTALTPSQGGLSPSPFVTSVGGFQSPIPLSQTSAPSSSSSSYSRPHCSTPNPTPTPTDYSHLNRSYSSSSSMLLSSSEVEQQQQQQQSRQLAGGSSGGPTPHPQNQSLGSLTEVYSKPPARYNRKFAHKRSYSNPLSNTIFTAEDEDGKSAPLPSARTSVPSYSYSSQPQQLSPTPPLRAGSHPSTASNSVSGSPSAPHKTRHPGMRRIMESHPQFSQSIPSSSNADALLHRQNTCPEQFTSSSVTTTTVATQPRCSSMTAGVNPHRSSSSSMSPYLATQFAPGVVSTSMVDLPLMDSGSVEQLDQISEYFPNSKSRSVPKLTLMGVSNTEAYNRGGLQSTSVPTSPRTPIPNVHMGHKIRHRFTNKPFLTPHVCDYCKKKLVRFGLKCKDCKFKCHKSCADKVPHSCGLPQEYMDFFRKQYLINSPASSSQDNFVSPSEPYASRPQLERSAPHLPSPQEDPTPLPSTAAAAGAAGFVIQDLNKEPTSIHFSPVLHAKKAPPPMAVNYGENGRSKELYSQASTSSLLGVPRSAHHRHSTSSTPSPSTSPPTSPSLTPSSPRSPNEPFSSYSSAYSSRMPKIVYTDESGDESFDDTINDDPRMLSGSDSNYSSANSSSNDISDLSRITTDSPRGLRPGPQVVYAHSLPDLLGIDSDGTSSPNSPDSPNTMTNGYASDDNLARQPISKKESLQRTLSTADSKTSTLVASLPTEDDDEFDSESYGGSQGGGDEFEYRHARHQRHSVVDEWNIPYGDIKSMELVGRGPVGEVYRGNWHGDVAIKRFHLPDATPEQLSRFKEEVSILKKTRHENLALFMGASLLPPNLAIVTSFCTGHTLYKYIHIWNEPFPVEKSLNMCKQVAQAMGYLHARRIVHKDLNTKNIFVDKGKIVITDTGLSSLTDSIQQSTVQCNCGYAVYPRTKLYYFAPELMRALSPFPEVQENGDLYPYSEKTDVYAFGTVMYELLVRRFPFATDSLGFSLSPSSLILMVGRGFRPEVSSREVPKRVKDLVWDCMHFDPKRRLPFSTIWDILVKLSRRTTPIARSPSFPISLSRSTESLTIF